MINPEMLKAATAYAMAQNEDLISELLSTLEASAIEHLSKADYDPNSDEDLDAMSEAVWAALSERVSLK